MITLATLKDATEQQVFDQVAIHMIKQGKKSLTGVGNCAYRGVDGLKCAAGCLIADDEYNPAFDIENNSWYKLVDNGYVPDYHSKLIIQLQRLHDNSPERHWESELRGMAFGRGLSDEVLNDPV